MSNSGQPWPGLSPWWQKTSATHNGHTGHEKHAYISTLDVQGGSPGCLGLRSAIVYSPVRGRLRDLKGEPAELGARILEVRRNTLGGWQDYVARRRMVVRA